MGKGHLFPLWTFCRMGERHTLSVLPVGSQLSGGDTSKEFFCQKLQACASLCPPTVTNQHTHTHTHSVLDCEGEEAAQRPRQDPQLSTACGACSQKESFLVLTSHPDS